jgi:hypothetical protein
MFLMMKVICTEVIELCPVMASARDGSDDPRYIARNIDGPWWNAQ